MFVEFNNKLYVLAEGKHGEACLPFGQRLAFQRLVDGLHRPPDRISIGFIVSHETEGDIDFSQLPVREFRYFERWHIPKLPISLLAAIDIMRLRMRL